MFGRIKEFYGRHGRWLLAGTVFLLSFVLYASTAAHTFFTNDNPEFITAAATAGIPHPSGYPLYVVATWLFAKLPLGSIAYRLNLFSALCAAASLAAGYFILLRVARAIDRERRLPDHVAAALILPFAATGIFWFQAIVAKTYPLNLLLTLSAALLAVRFREERRRRDLYLFALLAGLGIANHPMFALTLPFLAVLLLVKNAWNKKRVALCLGLFVLGLAPYAYIPIRSAAHPLLDWAKVVDWSSFWKFISRAQYNDLGVSAGVRDKFLFLAFFASGVWAQFGLLVVLLPLGFIAAWKRAKLWCYVLSALLVSNVFAIIALRNSGFNYANGAFNEPYFLPSYLAIYIFCAVGLWFMLRNFKKFAVPGTLIVCLLCAGAYLHKNFSANDLHGFVFLNNQSRETLLSLPPNAVLIVYRGDASGDTNTFSIMYQRYVNRLRPDVAIVGFPSAFPQIDNAAVLAAMAQKDMYARRGALYQYALKTYPNRPIYSTFPYFICTKEGASCRASSVNGFVYGPPGASTAAPAPFLSDRDRAVLEADVFGKQYLVDYYFIQAAFKLQNNDLAAAKSAFDAAVRNITTPDDQQYLDFMQFKAVLGVK